MIMLWVLEVEFSESPGIVPDMRGKQPVDFFNLLFDNEIKTILYDETSRHAKQYIEEYKEYLAEHKDARAHDWKRKPMVPKEVDALLAIIISMGVVGYPTLK